MSGFNNLPIMENVIEPVLRHSGQTVEQWLESFDCRALEGYSAEAALDLVYAYAYIHGVGDALDMTALEVLDAWRAEQ